MKNLIILSENQHILSSELANQYRILPKKVLDNSIELYIDESNNNWPIKELPTRFQLFKQHKYKEKLNPMQKAAQKELKP